MTTYPTTVTTDNRHDRLSTLACFLEHVADDHDAEALARLVGTMPVREGSALALALDGVL